MVWPAAAVNCLEEAVWRIRVHRHSSQKVCPWNQRFAEVAAERDYTARDAWEAE